MDNLTSSLNCLICFETVEDARLCPFCSRLCCLKCISQWICSQPSQQQCCVYCQSKMNVDQMIKLQWMDHLITLSNNVKRDMEVIDGDRNTLIKDRELFESTRDSFLLEKGKMEKIVEEATQQKEILEVEKNIVAEEKQTIARTLRKLTLEKERIAVVRQNLTEEKEKLRAEEEILEKELAMLILERSVKCNQAKKTRK